MVRRIPEMAEINKPYEDANNRDDFGEHVTKVIEFTLERCLFANLGRYGLVNMADCGAFAGQDYDGFRATTDNGRALFTKTLLETMYSEHKL
jgi:hypothetical protein